MTSNPQPQASAQLPRVAGATVPTAESMLGAFTNVTWQDTTGIVLSPVPNNYSVISSAVNGFEPEQPKDQIGRSIPTDTAITITVAPSPGPR